MEGVGWKAIVDDISRGLKPSCEIKIVEIGRVAWAKGLSEVFFPHRECTVEKCFYNLSQKWRVVEGQVNIGDIYRRHKLPYEIKIDEIGAVVCARGLSVVFEVRKWISVSHFLIE
ncbi:hypothetical protein AVEN_48626-1 [Araneus ventricosus]|uniref:Uncharacterized protein n=1 Tax=Araneus ventricosus TaxID=182803 RepID=A0A4Y2IX95_ARAVE|nr:hypothetical protein AVEN_48626-1 [Araneus ventricosus]